jgi:FAD synthetase
MTKVMCFGTFDIIHQGHLYLFSEARKLGDYLIVVVGRDSTVEAIKHKKPEHDETQRLESIAALAEVGEAVLGDANDYYSVIEKYRPDVICLGYDQKSFISSNLQEELAIRGLAARIVHIGSYKPELFKSSIIKDKRKNA